MNKGKSGNGMVIKLGIAGAVLVLLILFFLIFRVRSIDVYGNFHHSSEEIISDMGNGFLDSNTLYVLWKNRNNTVPDSMPYLNSISVKMESPSHISVTVSEKSLAGCVDAGDYVYFDENGIVMEITDTKYENVPLVTGINIGEVILYQKLPAESSEHLRTVLSIIKTLQNKQGDSDQLIAKEIRFSDNMEITLFVNGVAVQLGKDEYIQEKIANLQAIMKTMDGNLDGTLHLEDVTGDKDGMISFTPADETEAPEEEIFWPEDPDNNDGTGEQTPAPEEVENYVVIDMVFNSSGTLVYNVHVSNGMVVDAYGNQVPGCYVNEDGNVVDAYMNTFSSATGSLMN